MMIPLLVALLSPASPNLTALNRPSPRPITPAVQVWLSHRKTHSWGVRAMVNARTSADGYLLVLHADAAGRVRVLFPRNPKDDQFVQRGHTYELGDARGAALDDSTGHGVVLAVVAYASFTVDPYVRDGNWDLEALAAGDGTQGDPKEILLAKVRTMQIGNLRYDVASYADAKQRRPKAEPRYYAARDPQLDQERTPRQSAQQGKIYYPMAYGYSSLGSFSSRGGLNSLAAGALLSFPYRYDQFYRGARKVWW